MIDLCFFIGALAVLYEMRNTLKVRNIPIRSSSATG